MELSFDIRGNLKPYKRIEIEFDEFKNYFFTVLKIVLLVRKFSKITHNI